MRCGQYAIYRRTESDKAAVDRYTVLLDDADSERSTQPATERNHWRSAHPDYFVYVDSTPVRGCPIQWQRANTDAGLTWPEKDALDALPHFVDRCDQRAWDASGRLYRRPGYPAELNLSVPATQWETPTRVSVRFPLATSHD